MEMVNQIRSPAKAYEIALQSGEAKVKCPLWALAVKAVMGGFFAALGGHAAMVLASQYYDAGNAGTAKLAFGVIFSGALVCIMYTGADLVTSNCMNFSLLAYARRVTPLNYVIRMSTSLLGNYVGAIFGAVALTSGTGFFMETNPVGHKYLMSLYQFKLSLPFWRVICSALGCNCYVCMAVWASYVTLDSAGSIMAMILLITSFAVAGFEHIVANFYTLHAALFSVSPTSAADVYGSNFVPTLIGNFLAGSVLIGLPIHLLYGLNKKTEMASPHGITVI
ncbi:putative formate/nitrite transporter family protein [Babesia divergens]|uniref:Formate-nitrite transporter n=1 Tax=Babesia divergens TaxID=32595 RepID=A0AAD9LK50_BABDI|nr:putative formate/nitrite transporter family protein [Babesia divergens]